jgi:outer membrane protein TolC
MALDANVDLRAARLDPQISDTSVASAAGAYRPTINAGFNSNNQLLPPSSLLFPTATQTDVNTTNVGLAQRLPWFGTTYNLGWNAIHTNSNSILNSYNPLLQSGLSAQVSQPLLRDLKVDFARTNLATSRINRDIADTRLRETLVHTEADVKTAYWNLVTARANVDARKLALDLAQELVRVNKAKVDVGTAPPLDLVSAQAEVASDQEQLIIAETAVKIAEDRLRLLIVDPSQPDNWNSAIDPIDSPPVATATLDLDTAVRRALSERTDLARMKKTIENDKIQVKYTSNQKLPDVRLNASYQANGLGGTQILRSGGFPGNIIGSGPGTGYGDVLGQLFGADFPTWAVGVNISYPLGQSTEQANAARARLQQQQAEEQLKSQQAQAIQQVRNAYWQVDMNAKRIETTRAARELAEQRLDAERKRLDVGMSTSFLVIQAQRDLAQARTSELSAILSYDLSLVAFDELQQAGPSQQGSATANAVQTAQATDSAGGAIAAAAAAASRPTQTSGAAAVLGAAGNPQQ